MRWPQAKTPTAGRCVESVTSVWRPFTLRCDEFTLVRPPPGLRVRGKLSVLNRALCGIGKASRCFGKLVAEVMREVHFETVTIVPITYHHPRRENDTVVHGDDFVAVAGNGQLDHFEQVLENYLEIKRVGRMGPGRSSTG